VVQRGQLLAMIELWNAAYDKLYAAACHDMGDTADFGADYLEACARWYADRAHQQRPLSLCSTLALNPMRRKLRSCYHPHPPSRSDGPHRSPALR
jgi:hypothetical protein